jgi:hypothetical protein
MAQLQLTFKGELMFKKLCVTGLLAFSLVACKSETTKRAEVFANAISSGTGVTYQLVKSDTETRGYAVFRNSATGEFVAFNMNKYDRNNGGMTYEQFVAVAIPGTDIVNNLRREDRWIVSGYWADITDTRYRDVYYSSCDCYRSESYTVVVGQRYVDTSHWATYYLGGGFLFDTAANASRDLETLAALDESTQKSFVASRLQSDFSLSATRADELANVVYRYQRLESRRALTESEKSVFTTEAFGLRNAEIESALRAKAEGRDASYRAMLRRAAETNNTTPENMGSFFDQFGNL